MSKCILRMFEKRFEFWLCSEMAFGTRYVGARASRPLLPGNPPPGWRSRGRLPHWEAGERPQSITFRLADALPQEVLQRLAAAPPVGPAAAAHRRRFEALLDAGHGEALLRDPDLASLVQKAPLHFDGERYRLHAWCVMPNHVHVLTTPMAGSSLSSLPHSWKSFTAKLINRRLGRTGRLWFEEYFDRAIRNERHFSACKLHIEDNLVKAALCAHAADWPYSSAA